MLWWFYQCIKELFLFLWSLILYLAMFVQAHTIFLVPCFVVALYYAIIHISCIYHHFMLPFIVVFMANVRTCINTASTIWTVHWGNFEQLVVTLGHILLCTFTNYFLNINFSFITVSIYYVVHTVYWIFQSWPLSVPFPSHFPFCQGHSIFFNPL